MPVVLESLDRPPLGLGAVAEHTPVAAAQMYCTVGITGNTSSSSVSLDLNFEFYVRLFKFSSPGI